MDLNHNSQRLLLCAGSTTAACFNLEEDQVGPQQSDIRMPKVIGDSRAGQGSKLHRYILPHSGAMPLSCIIYRYYIYIILMHATCFERLYSQPLSEWAPYYQLE